MNIKLNLSPLQITKILTSVFVILSILNLIIQIAKYGFHYRQEWMVIFNMDREMNFPTLYTVILLIICATFLKQIAILEKNHQIFLIKYWKTLSFIFIFLAFDEALQIHEILIIPGLGKKLPGIFHFVWVITYGIAVAILGLYLAKFTFNLPKKIQRLFLLSASLYIGGALGMEMLEGLWVRRAGGMQNLVYSLLASTEEMMEIIGLIIFSYSLIIYLTQDRQKKIKITINIS